MTRSRIAIFEGYGRPSSSGRSFGRGSRSYGAPLFNNPRTRMARYGFDPRELPSGMSRYGFDPRELPVGMGRAAYYVPPLYRRSKYGPVTEGGRRAKALKRKGYKVKRGRNSPAQVRFKKAAKACARRRRGSFQQCMRKKLRRGRRK